MQSMPSIPRLVPVTTRAASLSVETRIEVIASVIACVLYDARQMQDGIPHTPFTRAERDVQRIYEAIGRQAATCILKPSRVVEAKRKAIEDAVTIMGHYDEVDEDDQRPVPPEVKRKRFESAFLSGLHRYHVELAREERR